MVFWETVTEKEEVRFRDWGILQALLAENRILKAHRRENICRLICTKVRREKVPQKNLRIRKETENLICTKIPQKGKPFERVGRKAMGSKAR